MSSHPNPGNRTIYISKEADQLTIAAAPDTTGFARAKKTFDTLPPALTSAELERRNAGGGNAPGSGGTPGQPVPPPSAQYRNVGASGIFEASVPGNWTRLA